jgi:hypothetical protein
MDPGAAPVDVALRQQIPYEPYSNIWVIWVKTTVEISDDLLKRTQRLAKREGTTLRAILEEGLRLALKARQARRRPEAFSFPTFGEDGLNEDFSQASWETIRETIYRDGNSGQK